MKMRMHSSSVSGHPDSSSMARSTRWVIGSLSTSTPSQSNSTAPNEGNVPGRVEGDSDRASVGMAEIDPLKVRAKKRRPPGAPQSTIESTACGPGAPQGWYPMRRHIKRNGKAARGPDTMKRPARPAVRAPQNADARHCRKNRDAPLPHRRDFFTRQHIRGQRRGLGTSRPANAPAPSAAPPARAACERRDSRPPSACASGAASYSPLTSAPRAEGNRTSRARSTSNPLSPPPRR